MSGSDAELRSRAEELAHLQERFDIHVMAFADQSEATAQALQRAFSVDRATAQRMLEGTPVVVKRGATPEVASALLDELNRVGAQVVLLPSDTRASLPPPKEAPSRAAQAPAPPASAASNASAKASAWGGLDLPAAPPVRPNTPFSSQREPSGALGGADALEESLDESAGPEHAPRASEAAPESDDELHLHSSAPPAIVRRSPPPRRSSEEIDLKGDGDPLQMMRSSTPPPRRVGPPPPRASAPPRASRSPKPPPPPPPSLPPEPRGSLRAPDLGLGTVPPLPSLSPRKSTDEFVPLPPSPGLPPPLSLAPQAARGRAARPAAPPPRAQTPVELHLPSVPRGPETRKIARSQAQQGKPRAGAEPARGGSPKRAGKAEPKAEAQRPPTGPVRTAFERDPFPAPTLSGPRGEFPVPPQPGAAPAPAAPAPATDARRAATPSPSPAKAEEPPARGLAVVLLFGSMLGLGLGIYVGDSVLQGMASPLSIALHGIALYGFGAGILGLRA